MQNSNFIYVTRWRRVCPFLLALVLVSPVPAAETTTFANVQLQAGYDSNGLRLNGEGREGYFGELLAQTGVKSAFGHRLELFANASGSRRTYESAVDDAGSASGALQAGTRLVTNPRSRHRLVLTLGGSLRTHRWTFTDRTTGEIYEVAADPPTIPGSTTPIPERYDNDVYGAFFDMSWRVRRNIHLSLATRMEDARYREDYAQTTALDSLDYEALTFSPGITFRLNRMVALGLAVVYSDLQYDSQPALNEAGLGVLGTRRAYEYLDYRVTLRMAPSAALSFDVGLRGGRRDDLYAGYYDFDSLASYVSLGYSPADRAQLNFSASLSDLDYDRAVIPESPNGEIRSNDVRRYVASFTWQLHRSFDLVVESGLQQTDSTDPIYAYDRDWVLTGVRFRTERTSGNK